MSATGGRHLERAYLLYEQSRMEMAEREVRAHLALEPESARGHSLLALCLARRKAYAEAAKEADAAVGLAPDDAGAHLARGQVLYHADRYAEAAGAADEAIRLAPEAPISHGLLASIRYAQERWQDALAAADRALALDPQDADALNIRAMALVKLGREGEAGATIENALARDPENALTHANSGWAYLHRNESEKALHHFREALRLDPQLGWAREGIVTALKSKYLIYGLMLRYFLWMSKLNENARWMVVIGAYVFARILSNAARAAPALKPYIYPILAVYAAFAIMSWIADPLFNLLLRLNRFGRLALSEEETRATNWFGGSLALALVSLAAGLATGAAAFYAGAAVAGLLVLPLALTFHSAAGLPRRIMAIYTAGLAILGAGALLLLALPPAGATPSDARGSVLTLGGIFFVGVMFSSWVANGVTLLGRRR